MPNPVLLDILIDITNKLEQINTDGGYFTNIENVFSFVTVNHSELLGYMPFVNVLVADSSQNGQESFKTNKTATIVLQAWFKGEDRQTVQQGLLRLEADIIKALMNDKKRSQRANWTHEGNTRFLIPESDKPIAGMLKDFEVNYDHNDNDATKFIST